MRGDVRLRAGGSPSSRSGGIPGAALRAATRTDRKSRQLCEQARRALEFAIGVECKDEVLNGLAVLAVLPDPTIRRLRVWLLDPRGAEATEHADALRRLAAARGFLRAQVAAAIYRKRTPELAFELVSGRPDGEGASSSQDRGTPDCAASAERPGVKP